MPMSEYMRDVRNAVGSVLLEVPSTSVIVRDDAGRVLLARHSEGNLSLTMSFRRRRSRPSSPFGRFVATAPRAYGAG